MSRAAIKAAEVLTQRSMHSSMILIAFQRHVLMLVAAVHAEAKTWRALQPLGPGHFVITVRLVQTRTMEIWKLIVFARERAEIEDKG